MNEDRRYETEEFQTSESTQNQFGDTEDAEINKQPDDAANKSGPLPGHVGRYRVTRLLGEGAFGRVYEAHDDELKRRVAIKVPRAERIQEAEDVEAYLAEAQTLASLDHPNIVPVFDVGRSDDGLCYVVSKFVEGATCPDGSRSPASLTMKLPN